MELPEASFVPFLKWALGGFPLVSEKWAGGASAQKDFSGPICILPKREHVWSCLAAAATTTKAPVHREKEVAQTLLVPMESNGLGEKQESALFLSKHVLGLSLVSRGEFTLANASPRS